MVTHSYSMAPAALVLMPEVGREFPSLVLKSRIEELTKEVERLELAKAAFEESEIQLDAMLDSVGECMTMIDRELHVIWSNKAGKELFGDNIIGRKCYQVYQRQERPCPLEWCPAMRTFKDGKTKEYDTRVLAQDGRQLDLHCTFNVAIREKNGLPVAVISVARDITARVRDESMVEQSKKEWERTFDALGELVIIHDRDRRIIRCNQAFRDTVGLPWKELIGKPCHEVFCGQPKECELCPLERTIRDKQSHSTEMPGVDPRSAYWVSTYPIFGDRNELDKVIRTTRDISELKGLEAQVRQAQKMEAIGTLAGGVAHDFNSILTAIHGYTELTVEQIPPEYRECHENLEQVLTASRRARELIKQILTFSRINDSSTFQPVLLTTILKETLSMMRAAVAKRVAIREIIACDSVKVMADPTQISQVVMNLCTNASQAMSEQGGVLEISLDKVLIDERIASLPPDLSPGLYCLLTVQDTGGGMDQETMNRIFEPFFTTKPEGVGTGMGLSVVHGIVKGHKGAIRVTSEKGRGTSFHVFIPALPDAAEGEGTPRAVIRLEQNRVELAAAG